MIEKLGKIAYICPETTLSMSAEETDSFLREVVAMLVDYIRASNDPKSLVVRFHHPTELRRILGHLLPVGRDHARLSEILRDCSETLKYCVRTGGNSSLPNPT